MLATNEQPYLIFNLDNVYYGINSLTVKEIFFLPELTPVPEAPRDIVGIVNVRGNILPVMDINLRFGYHSPDYKLSDSVIVIDWEGVSVGLIVNQVHEVKTIKETDISRELSYGRRLREIKRDHFIFIEGIAQKDDDIFILINPENLLSYVDAQELQEEESTDDHLEEQLSETHHNGNGKERSLEDRRFFCPNATPEEREIFRQRAKNLRQTSSSEDTTNLKPLAVVMLNKEYFGIDLSLVKEFSDLNKITPIPCCPAQIVGNMNLRGEILTLVDLGGILNLPYQELTANTKAMVVEVSDIVAGVVVEEVSDVIFLDPNQITTVPTAIHSLNEEYLSGAAPYRQKMMSLLDLPKIFLSGGLMVEQV